MHRSHSLLAAALLAVWLPLSPAAMHSQQQAITPEPCGTQKHRSQARFHLDGPPNFYKAWLEEDVVWIITDEEKSAFKHLTNDEERVRFIDAFWLRRERNPETSHSEFKEEHYRRIAHANERFGAGTPGWKTDRGRIYIMLGWPDEIENHAVGEELDQPQNATAVKPLPHPLEIWRYHDLEGVGQNVALEFVDTCDCGDYHLTQEPFENQVLAAIAKHFSEPLRGGEPQSPNGVVLSPPSLLFASPPPLKFPELARADQKVLLYPLPFDVLTGFVRVTNATTLVPVTIQFRNRDLTFSNHAGIDRAAVNVFGRISDLTGRVVETFEDTVQVDVPHEILPKVVANTSEYSHGSLLPAGVYKLTITAKDVNGDRIGFWAHVLIAPQFANGLAASSLILATGQRPQVERPVRHINGMSFISPGDDSRVLAIGRTALLPTVPPEDGKPVVFHKDQKINIWIQTYNLHIDDKKHAPSATVEYSLVNRATNTEILHRSESTDTMGPLADQLTLQKELTAAKLELGTYQLQIKVHDNYSGQTVSQSAVFTVE